MDFVGKDVNMFDDSYEVQHLSICATNCQTFTVCAIIREFDEDEIGKYIGCFDLPVATYIMVATKYHNYLYKLASDESGEDPHAEEAVRDRWNSCGKSRWLHGIQLRLRRL